MARETPSLIGGGSQPFFRHRAATARPQSERKLRRFVLQLLMPRFTPELLVLAAVLLIVSGIAGYAAWQRVPARLDPWAALDVRAAPAPMITKMKLARLQRERRLCDAALATAGLRVTRVAHRRSGAKAAAACPLSDVIYVRPENRVFGSGFHATCPLAVGLAMFAHHVMQPAARRHLGSEIARLEHLGTYSCRPIRGYAGPSRAARKTDPAGGRAAKAGDAAEMSEHATANAIDIAGFVTRDGRRVRVANDWRKTPDIVAASADAAGFGDEPDETPEARFLREVRDGACDIFGAVLGPEFNAAHRGHFHFDMGRHRACR